MPDAECPQTSAFPCPICHGQTNASPIIMSRIRTDGIPQFLQQRLATNARKWVCPTCSARAGEVPFTYLTFGGIGMPQLVVLKYHEGRWMFDDITPANIRWSIEHNGQRQPDPTPATAPTPSPTPAGFEPSAANLQGPGRRARVNGVFFFQDVNGRVFEWRHVDQPVEIGHWEQIGTSAATNLNSFATFCTQYMQDRERNGFRCDCGIILERDSPTNVYRRGLTEPQVREVEGNVAGYFHCNVESRHSDNQRRGFLRFSDGTVLSYIGETWVTRPVAPTPAPAGVDPQEVLRLLCDKLVRDERARGGSGGPEDVFTREVIRFWDSPESHDSLVEIARQLLVASGHNHIAQNL